ncbi:inter-alpha-trypsin inhibitor heavy chain H5-like [Acipenser oxyrinchus oxyrinchus]|uniref:Inter-alpha-trypsin inhibitor heavy chain H5-like n=1 Tax=Acipenser oxyrinchus oxyrinchus TaxID=40147 RepID=A0AAD8DC49_ACIOX|nr:inter-alpha-trypsin inhibitor heavy chain H5-like [Acipenser oxyrinchus oxyrinchus]
MVMFFVHTMITIILLFCLYPSVLGEEYANLEFDDNIDEIFSDLEPDSVGHRVPRQVKKLESKPHIIDFKVKTTIISRYAFTAVSCTMINRVSAAKEGVFQIQIPAAAYISNFTMIIGGRVYPSEVREKEKKLKGKKKEAKKPGNGAKAGNIESEMETFRIAASIPGKNKATFLLAYEELLQRRLGKYEHVTSVRPQQLVSKLSVEVNIVEHSEITYFETPQLRNGRTSSSANTANPNSKPEAPLSTVVNQTKTTCKVTFSPNIVQQARIARNGMLGDFVVRYDVERELGIGDIQVLNGYFVHYFAPKDLPAVPKNVVFVIDTSASMVGTKIRQTKEALFTILKDLRPQDHFNIVSFSNRIKVWQQGKLVPVTPDNIRDAKKFIYLLSPTGGTNINGGIQTGAELLSDYKASHRRTQGSVSLIIFLTDGRPTVGETQSSVILSNTKEAVQEQSCLFSIGIGNDVDYRLLERMALENCGMMRRIYEDADARTMLKGFYDEIGTPLLSDIHIDYTEDTVEYVTQKLFTNYFNGSEIVIAGKLSDQSTGSLHVQVKASNSDKSIMLETDVPLQDKAKEVEKNINSLMNTTTEKDYIERLWGYLSVKELLQSRLRSGSSRERETLSNQAKNLSLTYNFVTPVTSMVIEQPDIQMDKPRDDDADPLDEEHGEKPQSLHRNTKQPDVSVKKPEKKKIISKTSADGDPHFVVDFPLSKMAVCFNINGEPGDVLRLVSDHKNSGVTVNGKLIGAPAPVNSHKKQRTYFSTITIMVSKPQRSYIEITPRKVILDSKDRMVLPCDKTSAVERDGLAVSIVGKSNITVTVQGSVSFVILVHHYKNPAPYQRDHLGFYISSSKGLSSDSHGLLGQFLYHEVSITEMPVNVTIHENLLNGTKSNQEPQSPSTALKLKDRLVPAVKKQRKIHRGRHQVDCWFVKNNAAKLIDGVYQDYVVSHLFDTTTRSDTSNEL